MSTILGKSTELNVSVIEDISFTDRVPELEDVLDSLPEILEVIHTSIQETHEDDFIE